MAASSSSSNTAEISNYQKWEKSYEYWSKWKEPEEEEEEEEKDTQETENSTEENICGHTYDHQDEKDFYTKTEEEKLKICENSFKLGSYFLNEGNFAEAIYYFRLVSLRYEYCFPPWETDQDTLDQLRLLSYQHLAFLYIQVDELRWAIDAASRLLDLNTDSMEGYLYRAQAHRRLDEYEKAQEDLDNAIRLQPDSAPVIHEVELLERQQQLSLHLEKDMSSNMFHTNKQSNKS